MILGEYVKSVVKTKCFNACSIAFSLDFAVTYATCSKREVGIELPMAM